jgi:hypothetical protein
MLVGGRDCRTQFGEVNHPWIIPPKFGLKWPSDLRGEDFLLIVDGRTDDGCKVMTKAIILLIIRPKKKKYVCLRSPDLP